MVGDDDPLKGAVQRWLSIARAQFAVFQPLAALMAALSDVQTYAVKAAVCVQPHAQRVGSRLLGWHTECSLALLQRSGSLLRLVFYISLHASILPHARRIGHCTERFAAPEQD